MRHSDSSHEDSTQGRSWHSAECGRCMVVVHPRVTPNPGKSIKRLETDVDESNHTAQQRRDVIPKCSVHTNQVSWKRVTVGGPLTSFKRLS